MNKHYSKNSAPPPPQKKKKKKKKKKYNNNNNSNINNNNKTNKQTLTTTTTTTTTITTSYCTIIIHLPETFSFLECEHSQDRTLSLTTSSRTESRRGERSLKGQGSHFCHWTRPTPRGQDWIGSVSAQAEHKIKSAFSL